MKRLQIILLLLSLLAANSARAQWQIGIKGGVNTTSITRSQAGRVDESYSCLTGYDFGFIGRYQFNTWMAIRADLGLMQRSYRMDRNINYLQPVYTEHRNTYLMLPVMADMSFGGARLRGHLMVGGFAGYWLSARQKGTSFWMTDDYIYFTDFNEKMEYTADNRRFDAGIAGGLGLSYDMTTHWGLQVDALYYYDLVSHQKGYPHLNDPRYWNTISFTLGAIYKF